MMVYLYSVYVCVKLERGVEVLARDVRITPVVVPEVACRVGNQWG